MCWTRFWGSGQQPISKKINDYHKNNQKILKSFNNTMDEFLKSNNNLEIDHEIINILNTNVNSFKEKMKHDLEYESTGLTNTDHDDPFSFFQENIINHYFGTLVKPGRRPTRALNGLILGLYKTCYDQENSTYLPKVMNLLNFINANGMQKIEEIELSESIIRKRIKDLLKAEMEDQRQLPKKIEFLQKQNL